MTICGYELDSGDYDYSEHYGPCELPAGHDGAHRETREWETEEPTPADWCAAFGHHWRRWERIPIAIALVTYADEHTESRISFGRTHRCRRCRIDEREPSDGYVRWSPGIRGDGTARMRFASLDRYPRWTTFGNPEPESWTQTGLSVAVVKDGRRWKTIARDPEKVAQETKGLFWVTATPAPSPGGPVESE